MDGFFRIFKKAVSELICTRLYIVGYFLQYNIKNNQLLSSQMFFNYFYGFFTGLSLGEMTIFEVQFTTIFGPFDHGLGATIARNRNGMEVTLESFHIIQVITRRFSFKEKKKKKILQTLFDKDYSENDNEKSGKTNKV